MRAISCRLIATYPVRAMQAISCVDVDGCFLGQTRVQSQRPKAPTAHHLHRAVQCNFEVRHRGHGPLRVDLAEDRRTFAQIATRVRLGISRRGTSCARWWVATRSTVNGPALVQLDHPLFRKEHLDGPSTARNKGNFAGVFPHLPEVSHCQVGMAAEQRPVIDRGKPETVEPVDLGRTAIALDSLLTGANERIKACVNQHQHPL